MIAVAWFKNGARRKLSAAQVRLLLRIYSVPKRAVDFVRVQLAKLSNVGRRTHIEKSAHFLGWRNIRIGDHCVISSFCWFNVNHRKGDHAAIVVGDHSFIGQRNFFSSSDLIQIGPYALTGVDCRFMGADHVFTNPFLPYVATGVTAGGRLIVGANCWLGAGVSILGDVVIGHGCVVGAGSMITKSVPPFSLVVGAPARVVKRFDIQAQEWVAVAGFSAAQETALPDESAYVEMLRTNAPHIRLPIPAAGKSRGDLP